MMLLDLLLQIEAIEDPKDKETFAIGLYKSNRTFADLCDLAYKRSYESRYLNRDFPQYKQDTVPYGYHFSCLERSVQRIKLGGFVVDGVSDEKSENILIQTFESLSDIENKFVKEVIKKDIPWFPRSAWITARHG